MYSSPRLDQIINMCREIVGFPAKRLAWTIRELPQNCRGQLIKDIFGSEFFDRVRSCSTNDQATTAFCSGWMELQDVETFVWVALAAREFNEEISGFITNKVNDCLKRMSATDPDRNHFEWLIRTYQKEIAQPSTGLTPENTSKTAKSNERLSFPEAITRIIDACRRRGFDAHKLVASISSLPRPQDERARRIFGGSLFDRIHHCWTSNEAKHVFCDEWMKLYHVESFLWVLVGARRLGAEDGLAFADFLMEQIKQTAQMASHLDIGQQLNEIVEKYRHEVNSV